MANTSSQEAVGKVFLIPSIIAVVVFLGVSLGVTAYKHAESTFKRHEMHIEIHQSLSESHLNLIEIRMNRWNNVHQSWPEGAKQKYSELRNELYELRQVAEQDHGDFQEARALLLKLDNGGVQFKLRRTTRTELEALYEQSAEKLPKRINELSNAVDALSRLEY